jgi:hypothetical protein
VFSLLETKFGIDNILLLDLEILIQVIQLVIECDKSSPLFIELVLGSFIVILLISSVSARWSFAYLLDLHCFIKSGELSLGLVGSRDRLRDFDFRSFQITDHLFCWVLARLRSNQGRWAYEVQVRLSESPSAAF